MNQSANPKKEVVDMATKKQYTSDRFGEGIHFLRQAEETGDIDVTALVKLLDIRRGLLSDMWSLPIWQELGSCPVPSRQKCLGQLSLFSLHESLSIKSKGIFFPPIETEQDIYCLGGLLRPRLNAYGEVIKEACWCMVTLQWSDIPLALRFDDKISISELVCFYGHGPAQILTWLSESLWNTRQEAQKDVDGIDAVEMDFYWQEWRLTKHPIWESELNKK